jgi:RinA family phage transcriptional activator
MKWNSPPDSVVDRQGVDKMKLKRATYRHIEAEIYAYNDTLKAIEELRKDIILASRQEINYPAAVGGRYAGTSIVERRATKLADSVLLREMERITRAIEDTYARAKEECRRVVWVKYALAIDWQPPAEIQAQMDGRNRFDMSPDDMAEVLNVDRATFHRYRTGFAYGVAERLGWY